jgi:hypothetical protein
MSQTPGERLDDQLDALLAKVDDLAEQLMTALTELRAAVAARRGKTSE